MADFIFNGQTKIITEPAGAGDTIAYVQRDLYSAWKRWVDSGTGAPFPPAFSIEGGTPIGSTGLYTGYTVLMINGWRIRAASHDHQLLIVGNLYSDDGIVSVPTPGFSTNVFISSAVSAQGVSTGGGVGLTLGQIEASTVLAKEATVSAAVKAAKLAAALSA